VKWRRALVWLLAIGAAVLSFDALRAYALGGPALEGGVIPERTILSREWLAALWALEIDAMAAAGILGIGMNRRDWRAWAMFLLAAVASLGFQVVTPPVELARAVPPVALFLAIVILELRTGGAVAAEPIASRKVQTPRPSEQAAGSVADLGGHTVVPSGTPVAKDPRGFQSRVPATPPPSTPLTATVDADSPTAGEGGSLPDEPRPVIPVATVSTDRDQTVAPARFKPEDTEALRRTQKQKRKDPVARFEEVIVERGLDRDAAWAMARRNHWPVANGHREQVPA